MHVLKGLVYVSLLSVAMFLIYKDQITALLRAELTYVIEDRELDRFDPVISFCRLPGFRSIFSNNWLLQRTPLMNASEREKRARILENTLDVDDIFYSISFRPEITSSQNEVFLSLHEVVNRISTDTDILGDCFTIHWGSVIPSGGPNDYKMIIFAMQMPPMQGHYILQVYDRGDDFQAGLNNFNQEKDKISQGFITLTPTINRIFKMDITDIEDIQDCSYEYDTISQCIDKYLDSIVNCTNEDLKNTKCTAEEYNTRIDTKFRLRFTNQRMLNKLSGCMLPCKRRIHTLTPQAGAEIGELPKNVFLEAMAENKSVIVIQKYADAKVTHMSEVPAYSLGKFFSDMGGILGLLLGMSVWGLISLLDDTITKAASLKQSVMSILK